MTSQSPAEIRTGNSDGFERLWEKGKGRATIRVDPVLRSIHPLLTPLTTLEPYLADNSSFACSKLSTVCATTVAKGLNRWLVHVRKRLLIRPYHVILPLFLIIVKVTFVLGLNFEDDYLSTLNNRS